MKNVLVQQTHKLFTIIKMLNESVFNILQIAPSYKYRVIFSHKNIPKIHADDI